MGAKPRRGRNDRQFLGAKNKATLSGAGQLEHFARLLSGIFELNAFPKMSAFDGQDLHGVHKKLACITDKTQRCAVVRASLQLNPREVVPV